MRGNDQRPDTNPVLELIITILFVLTVLAIAALVYILAITLMQD